MRPVHQRILGPPDGDCFAACVASILELPLERVPNFHSLRDLPWLNRWRGWLAPANLGIVWHSSDSDRPPGYAIQSVPSPRFAGHGHAIVCWNGRPVHDPWPGGNPAAFQDGPYNWWYVISILDPTQLIDLARLPAPDDAGVAVDVHGLPLIQPGTRTELASRATTRSDVACWPIGKRLPRKPGTSESMG